MRVCAGMRLGVCVCVCVCVNEKERLRGREKETEREILLCGRPTKAWVFMRVFLLEIVSACDRCVCEKVRERESEREND